VELVGLRKKQTFLIKNMAKTRQQKEETFKDLNDKLAQSKGVVFARYMGLTVSEIQELRKNLRQEKNEMVVAKKTILARMLNNAKYDQKVIKSMDSGVAIIFGYQDEVSPAKILAEFAKKHEAVGFYAGILDGEQIDKEKVMALSQLPSRQELLAKMVGSIKAPITGLVNVLGGNLRGLVNVLNQIKEQKA